VLYSYAVVHLHNSFISEVKAMQAEKDSKAKPRKKTVTRIIKLTLVLIVVLFVLVLLLLPAFISSEQGRRIILSKVNNSIAGQTNFADLTMSWFKGISISDFGFSDNAGQISVHVNQIATKPHYGSIFTGNLSFGQTLIDKPTVEINLKDPQGKKAKEFQQEPPAGKRTQPIALPIKRIDLELNNGSLKVTDSKARTVELSQINSGLNLRPPGQQTDFDLNMEVTDGDKSSQVQVASRITPKQETGWSLKGTDGYLTIDVNELDLESLEPFFALAGIEAQAEGLVSGNVKSDIKDGRLENLSAGINAKNLDISAAKLKSDRLKTRDLNIIVKLSQGEETINIDNLEIKSDWAYASGSGVVPTSFESFADFLEVDSNYDLKGNFNCDVAAILTQLPETLGLKEGTQITSGRLNGNVETSTTAGRRQIRAFGTLAGLEGSVKEKKIALSEPISAEAQITSDKNGVNFDKLDVSSPFAKINCTGSIESLKYNADADLEKLQSEFGQFINIGQYQMTGKLLEEGQISIKEKKATASGSLTVKNFSLNSEEGLSASEPSADIVFAVDYDWEKGIVTTDSIRANASLGQFSVTDAVLPLNKNASKPLNLTLNANNVDLQKLRPFAVLLASFPKEMQLAGIAESIISVYSENDTYKITTDSTKIKNLKLASPDRKPFEPNEVSLAFDAEVNPEQKAVNVKKLRLESPQIKILKGELSQLSKDGKTKLEGQAECEYDWSAVSTVASSYLPEGLTLQGKRKDAVSFVSEYPAGQTDKLMPNLSAKAKTGFKQADYMGLNFGPTDVDIQVQNGLLKIAPFTTVVNEGQFNFAGQADFKETPALLKTTEPRQIIKDIKVNDETTGKLLKYLSPIFADAVNVSGIANLKCDQLAIPLSSDAKNHAVVIGTIWINQLRLQASDLLGQILSAAGSSTTDTDITVLPTKFILRNGFLTYDDMQMNVGDNPVNFKGVIGLDKTMDMTVTLPYTTEGRTARVDKETRGKRITLPLKGTLDKPELDMGKLLEEQLKIQLGDQLRKGLEDLFK